MPLEAGARPVVVRAFNVLRQYDEAEVAGAWATTIAGWRATASSSTARATSSAGSRRGWR